MGQIMYITLMFNNKFLSQGVLCLLEVLEIRHKYVFIESFSHYLKKDLRGEIIIFSDYSFSVSNLHKNYSLLNDKCMYAFLNGSGKRGKIQLSSNMDSIKEFILDALGNKLSQERDYIGKHYLTKQEIEVMHALTKGISAKDIAVNKGVSTKTVYSHTRNALNKLGFKKKIDFIFFFLRNKNENPFGIISNLNHFECTKGNS